jgi:sarcosine oxidase subunit alpha
MWDGQALNGFEGDTLASALLAAGVRVVGRSFKYHRPRGILAAWVEEPNALADLRSVTGHDPLARATTTMLQDGMVACGVNARPDVARDAGGVLDALHTFLPAGFYYKTFMRPGWGAWEGRIRAMAGLGRVPDSADRQHYEARHAQCDVLVVGGGPAGLAAAQAGAEAGLRVVLACDRPGWGGSAPWDADIAAPLAALHAHDAVTLLRTTVFGAYDHFSFGLMEQRGAPAAGFAPARLWTVRARACVLAAGAIERPLVFPDNDRPGTMLAGAVLEYLRRYGVLAGESAVIATNNDSAYATALALRAHGVPVTLADVRADLPPSAAALRALGGEVLAGSAILATGGHAGLRWVEIGPAEAATRRAARMRVACDLLATSGGWQPTLHLFSQAGGTLRWDEAAACLVAGALPGWFLAGAANGHDEAAVCAQDGAAAGAEAARFLNAPAAPAERPALPAPRIRAWWCGRVRGARQWIDLQNDVTVADIRLAVRENYVSVEHLKRYTTLGMATDQGKTANVNGLAVLAQATGRAIATVGTTTFRPPYVPVSLGALAGSRHGALYAPLRRLPLQDRHDAAGALMRDYGAWRRPACYPRAGEEEQQAVQREARAVRDDVGVFDGSSLGKIVVHGRDAAAFVNHLYYTELATLKSGRLRYALLLRETGIVHDDGVVARLGDETFLLSPSSAHAAAVLGVLEAWRQTELPHLSVSIHDATAAWATLTVSGPRSRAVVAGLLADLGSDIDVLAAALPHMALAQGRIGAAPVRIARVSFSGERSFELSVPCGYAASLWDAVLAQGAVPYGLESSSLLRLEKGYVLVGTDTDGTTMPMDLGMDRPLRTKPAFLGRRALLTPEARRADRRQLVGVLADDAEMLPPPGAHATEHGRSIGWITSAAFSPTLARGIALAMIAGGQARAAAGERASLFHLGRTIPARIVPPVFVDPAGERLRG